MASEPGPREKKLRLQNAENCETIADAAGAVANVGTDKTCLLYPCERYAAVLLR